MDKGGPPNRRAIGNNRNNKRQIELFLDICRSSGPRKDSFNHSKCTVGFLQDKFNLG